MSEDPVESNQIQEIPRTRRLFDSQLAKLERSIWVVLTMKDPERAGKIHERISENVAR